MNSKIETLPKYRIAYVRQIGPYGSANVQTMQKLKKWAAAKNLLSKTSIILGISHDNPETTLPENCRYDAGIVISDDYQIDDFVDEREIFGGKYAIFKVKHTAEDIQKAWSEIFSELINYGYQIDARPIFERYMEEMVCDNYCEICVPITS
ncbi:AraC family transcriptional regulator [Aneurinibacillus uraniidurans]|uniref:AraC family transcriptional regulator n=1 Tax=Aneurinibacillus uraniidurans TaxID=2966586 RepID=UPI00234B3CE0|nr:GyrI-like domain-containing protein [Aneurinibacillus sp. B1]WCN39636.1 GyrI-like domain-containing protein [Aneurinibacillus sp. B1]